MNTRSLKEKAYRLAKSAGASIEVHMDAIYFDLPKGTEWAADGGHTITALIGERGVCTAKALNEIWSDVVEQMKYGTRECSSEGCEVCE